MSQFLDPRTGHFKPLEIPDELAPWPELEEATATARRLEGEFRGARDAHEAAKAALEQAVAADRAALAEARLRGSKRLPEPKGVADAKSALEEAKRQMDALDDARRRAAEIIVQVVEQNRERWVGVAEGRAEEAQAEEAAALTAYLEATSTSARARETVEWLAHFPERRHYRPQQRDLSNDVVLELKIRAGLADPPPRTLAEHARAAGRKPAPEIVGDAA